MINGRRLLLLGLAAILTGLLPAPLLAQEAVRTGRLHVIWGDDLSRGAGLAPAFVLIEGARWTLLVMDERVAGPTGSLSFNRRRVRVTGRVVRARPEVVAVTSIRLESPGEGPLSSTQAPVVGSQPWITILCRFADSPTVTPHDKPWFEGLMGAVYPGMDHYFREVSGNVINLIGSAVVGWYNLPQPRAYYVPPGGASLNTLLADCSAAADAEVYFPAFAGINLVFNDDLGCCAWGGSASLTRDGQTRSYGVTWLPWPGSGGYRNQGLVAHEMGHGFGLPHSSGPYGATYDSKWDPMSNPNGMCIPPHAVYGCIGVHTISHHKDRLTWVGPTRKIVPAWGFRGTVALERHALPQSGTAPLMVQLPIFGSLTNFYTVEARRFAGYDAQIPGEAVVLHLVDTSLGWNRPARVVDVDGNGNPNDAGAMWTAGETFLDKARGIRVAVTSASPSAFNVTVAYGPGLDTIGVYQPASGTFLLRNSNTAGTAEAVFGFGPGGLGYQPLVGDWNGDGADTVGIYNPLTALFFLRNTNSAGVADLAFAFGPAGAGFVPLVGDWNGDGIDTIGVYQPLTGLFFLRNANGAGVADLTFAFGPAGAGHVPLVGDWNGDGIDTVGLYHPPTGFFFLRNSNGAGVADLTFGFGSANAGNVPVVGDWDGSVTTTVGVYHPPTGRFFLRNSNSAGVADLVFTYGPGAAGFVAARGDWDDR